MQWIRTWTCQTRFKTINSKNVRNSKRWNQWVYPSDGITFLKISWVGNDLNNVTSILLHSILSHFREIKIYRRFHGRSNDEVATSFVSLTCVAVPDGLRSPTASTASVEVLLVDRGPFFCLRFFFRAPPPPDFLPSLQRTRTNSARVSIIFRMSGIHHQFMVRLIESMCVGSVLRTFCFFGWSFRKKNVNGLCFFFKFLS